MYVVDIHVRRNVSGHGRTMMAGLRAISDSKLGHECPGS